MKVRYQIENPSPKAHYVFQFLFDTLGLLGECVEDNSSHKADLYYGNESRPDFKVVMKQNNSDLIWSDLVHGKVSPRDFPQVVPFDLIHAIGAFLTDRVNKEVPPIGYDIHDRLKFDYSFQTKNKIAGLPLVNLYVLFLKSLFQQNLHLECAPLWPQGKQCAIGLSHDVDIPDKYCMLRAPWRSKNLSLKADCLNNLKRFKDSVLRAFDRDPEDFWLFEEIMKVEEQFSFKSTFFFASGNQFSNWGSINDVCYDIDSPKFKKVFQNISERGFEIGLHASYNAYLDGDRFAYEKKRLQQQSETEVKGLRHHFWHTGKRTENTLSSHGRAGFEYDSSIAFNDSIGFRRNVALPYYPWSEKQQRSLDTLQLPVFCMDGNLFYQPVSVDEAVRTITEYVATIRRLEGVGVIDWHVRTSYPGNKEYAHWGEAYLAVLNYLSNQSDVWVTNLADLERWWRKRKTASESTRQTFVKMMD
ncbi:hypothetical protein MJD09_23780 [bacterium]|nr:hypothetical protein [bacterium]